MKVLVGFVTAIALIAVVIFLMLQPACAAGEMCPPPDDPTETAKATETERASTDTPVPVIFPSPTDKPPVVFTNTPITPSTATVIIPTWTDEPGGGGKQSTKTPRPTVILILNTPVSTCTENCICLIGTELAEANDLTRTQIAISLTQNPNSCPLP